MCNTYRKLPASAFSMVEQLQQGRPSWTSENREKSERRYWQVHTSGSCAYSFETPGGIAAVASSVGSGAADLSNATHPGEPQGGWRFPVPNTGVMAPRRRTGAHVPLAAKTHTAAETATADTKQHALGSSTASTKRAGETQPLAVCGGLGRRDRNLRRRGRWVAPVVGQEKDRRCSGYKDAPTGDTGEQTSSPSLSWEDVEDSLLGTQPYVVPRAEYYTSMQRACTNQPPLRSRGALEKVMLPHAQAKYAFSDEELELSSRARGTWGKTYSAADSPNHVNAVEFAAIPQRAIKGLCHFQSNSRLASPSNDATRWAALRPRGDNGVAEEAPVESSCRSVGLSLFDEGRGSRRRALSCPCTPRRLLRSARSAPLSCTPVSSFLVPPAAASAGQARDTAGPPGLCVPRLSPQCTTVSSYRVVKSRTSGPSCFPRFQRTPESAWASELVAGGRYTGEQSDSEPSARAASSSGFPLGPHFICPFYARGLCPAGAAAAAAVRTPLQQQGNVFAKNRVDSGAHSSVIGGRTAIGPLPTDSDAASPVGFAPKIDEAREQASPAAPECDACSYCADTCDYISCVRCLPHRSQPDALPPYVFGKEASQASAAHSSPQAVSAAVDALHIDPYAQSAGPSLYTMRRPAPSPRGSHVSVSSESLLPSSTRLADEAGDVRTAGSRTELEESPLLYSRAKGLMQAASAPVSGKIPEVREEKDATERRRLGAGWTQCSWFPYRCLRAVAPPARPPVSYSQCQVDRYCRNGGCWILANGLIYDALPILYAHPGGPDCLLRKRGQDCSRDFSFHSKRGQQLWSTFVVGKVKPCRGWTERKQLQKKHSSACISHQEKQVMLVSQTMADTPSNIAQPSSDTSVSATSEATSFAESEPQQCGPSHETHSHGRDNGSGRDHAKDHYGKPSAPNNTSICRIM